jgi:hypothetical protein
MPKGLRITYDDGGPAMEITAGLRCPSFCQNVSEAWDVNQYTINQRVDGSQIVLIPRNTVYKLNSATNLIPTIGMLDGFTVSGNTITMNTWWSDNWGRQRPLMHQSGKSSILIWKRVTVQDSTDFLSITDATMSGYCVWRGTSPSQGAGLHRRQISHVIAIWCLLNGVLITSLSNLTVQTS